MKQLYISLFIATLFFLPGQVQGQSFDIVDPGLQIVDVEFDLEIENATDGNGLLNGDYNLLVDGQFIFNQTFSGGETSFTRTVDQIGEKTISVGIYSSAFSLIASNSTTITVHNSIWLGGDTGNENDWGTAANWNPSGVPGEDDCIGIPASPNDPEISGSNYTVKNVCIYLGASLTVSNSRTLTVKSGGLLNIREGGEVIIGGSAELSNTGSVEIESGGILTIGASGSWTAGGTVTNSAGVTGIVMESDAGNTGSIIVNNDNIQATAQRYMTGQQWHVISSPVTDQGIGAFISGNDISSSGGDFAMTEYNEDKEGGSGGWDSYYTSSTTGTMLAGRGYLVGINNNGNVTYKGKLAYQNSNRAIFSATNGWNAVGNPFPSAIGVTNSAASSDDFLTNNSDQLSGSYIALYVYNPGSGDYDIINNSTGQDYIQPGQGFLVKARSGGGELSFTTGMRFHSNSATFYKKSERVPWPVIRLKVFDSSKSATTVIAFNAGMTRGLDPSYDAGQFGGDSGFRLYTRLVENDNEVDFAIQALPDFGFEDMVIPVGFDFAEGGEVTFSAAELNLPFGAYAILEDRLSGIFTDLEQQDYSVTIGEDQNGPGRFFIHTDMQVTAIDDQAETAEDLNTYYFRKEIFIQGEVRENTYARLFDMTGKEVKAVRLQPSYLNSFRVDEIETGIYILRVSGTGNRTAKRLFIE